MAHKNTQAEELYEVACLLLCSLRTVWQNMGWSKTGPIARLIRRAEKATKARPK